MALLEQNIRPLDILTLPAFNALRADMAIGCSSNTVLHVTALSYAAGCPISLEYIDEIGRTTPQICKLSPASYVFITDLNLVGGIQAVLKELDGAGLINRDILTVSGTVAQRFSNAPDADGEIIRKIENPFSKDGGLAILFETSPRGRGGKAGRGKAGDDGAQRAGAGIQQRGRGQRSDIRRQNQARRRGGNPLRGAKRRPGYERDALPPPT